MTASDSLFDSRGRFSGPSYPMKTYVPEIEGQTGVAMATNLVTKIDITGFV